MKKLFTAIILAILASSASAATYTVDDDGPADFNTIQAAVNAAGDNDIIIVHEGTYYEHINIEDSEAITLRSTDPNDPNIVLNTIIDGNNTAGSCIRLEYSLVTIDGFHITNGSSVPAVRGGGGGIFCSSSTLILSNCTFSNNSTHVQDSAEYCGGGAIFSEWCNITIVGCTFTENSVQSTLYGTIGGAICCYRSTVFVDDSSFNRNSTSEEMAGGGGAVHCNLCSEVTFTNCEFNQNRIGSGGVGTAIYLYNYVYMNPERTFINCNFNENSGGSGTIFSNMKNGSTTLTGCTFNKNTSEGVGGIYYFQWDSHEHTLNITDCSFIANSGPSTGAIYCDADNVTITNCSFIANSATGTYGDGGALNIRYDNLLISNCTFSQNSASNRGGGMYCSSSSDVIVKNSIFWANTAPTGPQIYDYKYSNFDYTYCNIQGGWPGLGNIDVDPCFVIPGYWDPNSTPTDADDDFWVDGDYHLKSSGWRWDSVRQRWDWDDVTSRCIDAGNPGSDLANEPNTVDEWTAQNLRINMGAYGGTEEASMPPYDWALLCDIDNSGITDLKDFTWLSMLWLNQDEELFADFNRDLNVDSNDLDLLIEDWLSATTWH